MNPRPLAPPRRARRRTVAGVAGVVATIVVASVTPSPAAPAENVQIFEAPAVLEATPSDIANLDSLDDPAIWVDPDDIIRSVVIGADHADKSLSVYGLDAQRIHRFGEVEANNVDLRTGFPLAGQSVPVLGVAGGSEVSFFTLDPSTRQLANVTSGTLSVKVVGAHGICMYHSPVSDRFFAFVVNREGTIYQYRLDGSSGAVAMELVRTIDINPQPQNGNDHPLEGCVADEAGRSLFLGEHDWNIWRYGAEPGDPAGTGDRVMVDQGLKFGGHFFPDVEGMTVVHAPNGEGYLIASSQGDATFTVYRSTAPYEFVRKVKVVASAAADGCDRTDGVEAKVGNFGPDFPHGLFVCQDNNNSAPGEGNMNLKFVRLETIIPAAAVPATPVQPAPPTQPEPIVERPSPGPPTPAPSGYWMLGSAGQVFPFGDARAHGRTTVPRPATAVDIEPTPGNGGYWILDDRGGVTAHGDAAHHGAPSAAQLRAGESATSLSATRTGSGYWIFTSLGRVFAFGDATHLGDLDGTRLNGPVLDSITTRSGRGYYMVGSDGGIFSFGDAAFLGSMGGQPLNAPVESLVPDPDGTGYWLVASDGGVFTFAAPFRGAMGGTPLNAPVTGMVAFGNGYLMVAADGGIFNFSDRAFHGSLGDKPPSDPVTAVAAVGIGNEGVG